MFVFLLANIPFPLMVFLNLRVTLKYLKVHRLSRKLKVEKPRRLTVGWWVGNVAAIFFFLPSVVEHRIFVQDHRWLFSYGLSAALTITGQLLIDSALGEELRYLKRKSRSKHGK